MDDKTKVARVTIGGQTYFEGTDQLSELQQQFGNGAVVQHGFWMPHPDMPPVTLEGDDDDDDDDDDYNDA